MKKITLILALSLFAGTVSFCQRGKPVVPDAITLMQLLQKDYSGIEDALIRVEAINTDRARVISLMESYIYFNDLAPAYVGIFDDSTRVKASLGVIQGLRNQIKKLNAELTRLNISTAPLPGTISNFAAEYNRIATLLEPLIDSLQNEQRNVGDIQLRWIERYWVENSNFFLQRITSLFRTKYRVFYKATSSFSTSEVSVQKSLPLTGLGGLSFTNAIDGLARFLAARIKDELAAQVFDRIQKELNQPDSLKDNLIEIKILLPKTTQFLLKLKPDQYSGIIESLKQNIENDIQQLVDHLPDLQKSWRVQAFLNKPENEKFRLAFEGINIIRQIDKSKHPIELVELLENTSVIQKWKNNPGIDPGLKDFANGVSLAGLLVSSFTVEQNGTKALVDYETWKHYSLNNNFYETILGLWLHLDKTYYRITFQNIPLWDFLEGVATAEELIARWEPPVSEFLKNAQNLDNQLTVINKLRRQGVKIGADTLFQFIKASIDFVEEGVVLSDSLVRIFNPHITYKDKIVSYLEYARLTTEIFNDLRQKDYAEAIANGYIVYSELTKKQSSIVAMAARLGVVIGKLNQGAPLGKEEINSLKGASKLMLFNTSPGVVAIITEITGSRLVSGNPLYDRLRAGLPDLTGIYRMIVFKQELIKPVLSLVKEVKDQFTSILGSKALSASDILKLKETINRSAIADSIGLNAIINSLPATLDPTGPQYAPLQNAVRTLIADYRNWLFLYNLVTDALSPDEVLAKLLQENENDKFLKRLTKWEGVISQDSAMRARIFKFAHFIDLTAKAESAEDFEKAIEAFAMPVGSYRTKREARVNIDINAYPGFFVGAETIINPAGAVSGSPTAFNTAFTVPIGPALSWGNKNKSAWTIFASVIDIGAVTSLRFKDSESELPVITFQNILAPGIHFLWGLPRSPFTVGVGTQYGPALRSIKDQSTTDPNDEVKKGSFRYGFSFMIDIPIVNISTRTR